MSERDQENGRRGGKAFPLTTIPKARKKLVSLINEFYRGEIKDVARFRAMIYALSVLLQYFTAETEAELEERVARLEKRLLSEESGNELAETRIVE